MDSLLEKELVALCRSGDKSAYAELVRAYSGRVFGICLGMLGNAHDAEDVAQQALLAGFTDIDELRRSESFGVWLSRITRNLCIDFYRSQNRKRRALRQRPTPGQGDPKATGQLDDALAKLPVKYRVVLVLYYFDGRNARNIAETLDISQAAVCTRLTRGRKQLRRLLEGAGDK